MKQRIQKEVLFLANLNNTIHNYMLTEPQIQTNNSFSSLKKFSLQPSSSPRKIHSILHFVVPGGLGGSSFQNKIKNSQKQSYKQRIMHIAAMIETAKRNLLTQKEGQILNGYERQRYWEMLGLVLKKKTYQENFKKRYPDKWLIVRNTIHENKTSEEKNFIIELP